MYLGFRDPDFHAAVDQDSLVGFAEDADSGPYVSFLRVSVSVGYEGPEHCLVLGLVDWSVIPPLPNPLPPGEREKRNGLTLSSDPPPSRRRKD